MKYMKKVGTTKTSGKRDKHFNNRFLTFQKLYQAAQLSLSDRNELVNEAVETLEHDLTLLGITGVEDELRDNVNTTLETLSQAGVKVSTLSSILNKSLKMIL